MRIPTIQCRKSTGSEEREIHPNTLGILAAFALMSGLVWQLAIAKLIDLFDSQRLNRPKDHWDKCLDMPKGLGRMQRRLLQELYLANRPQNTAALLPGRSCFEKRRALRKLAAEGLVREIRPDTWTASQQLQRTVQSSPAMPADR